MLKNYIKIAMRNLLKYKAYSLINILGLSLGLTGCILITLYVMQELSFDRYHENADSIYRIQVKSTYSDREDESSITPGPVAPAFVTDFPEIEKVTRAHIPDQMLVEANDKRIIEKNALFADSTFFKIFSYEVTQGNLNTFLNDPSSVILTESTAKKYFAEENPISQTFRVKNKIDYKVAAVIKDVPVNSHFSFDFVLPFSNLKNESHWKILNQWGAFFDTYTYMLLPNELEISTFAARTKDFFAKHANLRPNVSREITFKKLTDIHLKSHAPDEIKANNYISNLVIIAIIGVFILLIACINFMNLSTARSTRRAKEVGVRKVLGAWKLQLIKQFLGESIVMAAIALGVALVLVELLLPYFSQLVGIDIQFAFSENLKLLNIFFLITLTVGLAAGIYPALIISSYLPIEIVKGTVSKQNKGSAVWLRKGLVVAQFVISIVFIFGTLITNKQLDFLHTKDMGFKTKQTIVIPIVDRSERNKSELLKNEFLTNPNVVSASAGFRAPVSQYVIDVSAYPDGFDGNARFTAEMNFVDTDYITNYGMQLLAGRSFSKEFSTDSKEAFIINETLAKKLNYQRPQDAIGNKLPTGFNHLEGTIVGVVKDFHTNSLHTEIKPLIMLYRPDFFRTVSVEIRPGNMAGTIAFLEGVWQKHIKDYPFQYNFLNDSLAKLYTAEENILQVVTTSSALAIFIACLGLFGLSAFTAEQRTKEIGVRKVLGASMQNIILLLSQDFLKLILVAGIIAIPIGYYAADTLLQNFAYRIEVSLLTGLLATVMAIIIALATVSFQAVKAAVMNPVETLRYE